MQYNVKMSYAQPYTLASRTSQRLNQNLPISMSLPTLKKMLTKFEIMNEMIKHESTTLCISNGGKVLKMNKIHKINGSIKMKVSAKNPAIAHTLSRYTSLIK